LKIVKALLIIILFMSVSGCLIQRLSIVSDPPGAKIIFNRQYVGDSPQMVPFKWYWYNDIVLKKEGYKTLKVNERIKAPFYLWIPFDFFVQILPFKIYDTRYLYYTLEEADKY